MLADWGLAQGTSTCIEAHLLHAHPWSLYEPPVGFAEGCRLSQQGCVAEWLAACDCAVEQLDRRDRLQHKQAHFSWHYASYCDLGCTCGSWLMLSRKGMPLSLESAQ